MRPARGGARTLDHKIKSLALYRLSYPGVAVFTQWRIAMGVGAELRSGAVEAWRAHNPQVPGSKPGFETNDGVVAQVGERSLCMREARGSIPRSSRPCGQMDKASVYETEDRRFDPCQGRPSVVV